MKLAKFKNGNLPSPRSLFADFFDGEKFFSDLLEPRFNQLPSVNIREDKDEFDIELAAPGMQKKDFHIDVENGMITISAEKEEDTEEKKNNYTRREYNYNSFSRSFALPDVIEEAKIDATYEDGVLRIRLPKKEEAKVKPSKKIEIR